MKKTRNFQLATSMLKASSRAIKKVVNVYRDQEHENRQMTIEDYFPRWEDGDYE